MKVFIALAILCAFVGSGAAAIADIPPYNPNKYRPHNPDDDSPKPEPKKDEKPKEKAKDNEKSKDKEQPKQEKKK